MYVSRSSEETLHNMRGVSGINRAAAVSFSGLRHYLSINGRESLLYSRDTMYEVFLGGYSTLNNDYVTFYIRHVTCKYKKRFHSTFECLKNHLMRA